jgi:hypothetical protein
MAVVPLLLPVHSQVQGPAPLTAEAVPALQRPALGAALNVMPFAGPQAPFTAVGSPVLPALTVSELTAVAEL